MKTLLNSGDILNSRYRILHSLGHGGFGRAYLAEDINRFNERCVLKEFAPQLQGSFTLEKAQELFEREAGVLYRLQHPQIPKFRELFRYRQQKKGHLLLVQDYIEGQTYHTLFNHRAKQGKRFSEAEINQLLSQMLPVLEYIHSMGIIHRDISPDNLILRSADELPMLIDFGSIKEIEKKAQIQLIETTPCTETLSLTATVIGKSGYAPLEQIEQGVVFPHSDLYALAATAVVLLTGKQAQKLIDPDSYYWNWQEEVTVTPKLKYLLTTMLAPNPRERFSSATDVIKNLEASSISLPAFEPTKLASIVSQSVNRQLANKLQILPSLHHLPYLQLAIAAIIIVMSIASLLWLKDRDLNDLNVVALTSNSHNFARAKTQLQERFSEGEKVLISQTTTPEKELAAAAFAKGNYTEAISLLSASLKTLTNDPEALIYFNNAQIGREKSYSIAVSIPIGSDVNAAQEILRGVAQAQTLVNQRDGINGIALKVQIINDDNNSAIARQTATTLSQNPKILGVVGHYASDVTLATARIYQSHQLVAISPISTSVELSNLSPYLFRTVPSDYIAARALAEYMLELKQKNVAVFYNSQSNYSKSLKSEFIAAVSLGGGEVVNTFDLSDTNFSAADSLQEAMDGGAEVLMLAANTGTLDKALQVVQVNRQRLSLLGEDDIYTPKTLQVAGELAKDMVLAIPWHIKSNPQAEFAQDAKKLWGGKVNWRTAMAIDVAKALIAAIDRHPTRLGVQKALSQPNFSTPGACNQIHFLPSGDRLKQIELVKIQPSNGNYFSYEFMPIFEERSKMKSD